MLPYKERESNLDTCLSPFLNINYQKPVKYPMKYLHLFISGSKCKNLISWFFINAFNFGYVYNQLFFKQMHASKIVFLII